MTISIIQGDCIEVLKTLPDESVHCCVTSPPYWGLRDYGIPQSVWGGDQNCEHERGEALTKKAGGRQPSEKKRWQHTGSGPPGHPEADAGSYCQKCGAWFGSLGLEPTPELYVDHLVQIFREVRRVLRSDGTLWLNLGDSYNAYNGGAGPGSKLSKTQTEQRPKLESGYGLQCKTLKPKDLIGIPWRVAFALQDDGWWLRSDIIWAKPNPMPESVTDRPTKAHEYLFLLAKSERYYFDQDAVRQPHEMAPQRRPTGHTRRRPGPLMPEHKWPGTARDEPGIDGNPAGRNIRTVWNIATQPFPGAHFATFPTKLIEPCIKAGTSEKGCCVKCEASMTRVTEKREQHNSPPSGGQKAIASQKMRELGGIGRLDGGRRSDEGSTFNNNPAKRPPPPATLGWQSSCSCNVDTKQCTVLDPFSGAGTTGLVADRLDRNAILIELNPEYVEIQRRRLFDDAPLFAKVQVQ